MSKISIIGAGNVGATAAMKIASDCIANEVVILDIKEGVAEGKAMDIMQSLMMTGTDTIVKGVTNDYSATADSDVIVITSGVPRKPGMTREELVGINSNVMKQVLEGTTKYSPNAKYLVVSNPMDTMTQMVLNYLGVENANRVIGMGGILDSARFTYNIFMKLQKKYPDVFSCEEINAMVIGGHGDTTMIPMVHKATVCGKPIKDYLSDEEIAEIVDKTMRGGAILTNMLGTSAWTAPAQGITEMVAMLLLDDPDDENTEPIDVAASVYRPEYGCCIGSHVWVGINGVAKIFDDEKNDAVLDKYLASIAAVKKVNAALPTV